MPALIDKLSLIEPVKLIEGTGEPRAENVPAFIDTLSLIEPVKFIEESKREHQLRGATGHTNSASLTTRRANKAIIMAAAQLSSGKKERSRGP